MSFEEEWAALVAKAKREQATRMQLNGLPGQHSPGRLGDKLHVTPSELRSRAGKADDIRGKFTTTDDYLFSVYDG